MSDKANRSLTLIVFGGPTASGKNALALDFARAQRQNKKFECEFVCADSVTVYKGLEIGAAKPTRAERVEFPHHLLDVATPTDTFTAGDFVRLAVPAINAIQERGALPLVVGGTGFYMRALLRGMASDEGEDPARAGEIKGRILARAAVEGWEVLHRELLLKDPGSGATVHVNDHYRITRALQASELYGRPWSVLNLEARAAPWRFPGTRFFCLELPRPELRERIQARTDAMLAAGLLNEVRGLLEAGVPATAKPLLSVGYKECLETIQGRFPESSLSERITQSTQQLARSQGTWFRGEQGVEWLGPPHWESLCRALEVEGEV